MICPKCGFEQPDGPECLRCGIVFSRYKGPVLGEAAHPAPPPPLLLPGSLPVPPEPAMAAADGTMYAGSPPAVPVPTFGSLQPASPRTLDMGRVLGETFSIYFRNFLPFLILTCIALSPLILALVMLASGALTGIGRNMAIVLIVILFLSFIFGPQLATASITYGVFQQMRGRDVSIADCLGRGLSSLLPVMALVIVQGLGIALGLIACIIPGILLYLRWAVSVPAAVEERPGLSEALRRSTFLTEGHRGTIFGILFVVNLVSNMVQRGVGLALGDDPRNLLLALGVVIVLSVGFSATATAVMYYRLRSLKESIDVDQIASVFA